MPDEIYPNTSISINLFDIIVSLYYYTIKYLKLSVNISLMGIKSFVIRLDEDLWEKFTIKCVKNRKSKNEVVVKLIKEYIKD